ncbi:hypothetical protein Y1Q_0000853 [Alligator mississippiensis]|uniref:Uncharacterized protein n=1 Tax=Alligator mississippiensis TaxID=8496 RepID=A0A151NJK3_ALLMI|nr:hypothetical protein Y1Q_0000853 [Alligator mississippiensis]
MEVLLQVVVEGPGELSLCRQKLSILACTNDLVLDSDSKQLQKMLDFSSEAAKWMGLRVSNCAFLHVDCRKNSTVLDSTVTNQDKQMRCLRDGKSDLYLGMPTDHWAKQIPKEAICGIMQDVHKLD